MVYHSCLQYKLNNYTYMLCMYNHTDCEENSSQIYSNAFMQNRTQKGGNGRSHTLTVLLLLSAVLP